MKKILVILLAACILVGCQSKKDDDKITIGVILPLTGELSGFGSLIKDDILFAYQFQDTSKYKLEFIDSKSESKTAILGLHQLINTYDVEYVIGDVGSSVTMSLIPTIDKHKIVLLSPGASSPQLQNISPFFARNYPTDVQESKDVAQFIYQKYQNPGIALIHSNTEYGIGLCNGFIESYANSTHIVLNESYDLQQTDFKAILSKLKSSGASVLYLMGEEKSMGRFMKQYKDMHLRCDIISNINFLQPDCINPAGIAAEGVIIPLPHFDPNDSTYLPTYEFAKKFQNIKKTLPSLVDAVAFDALSLMIQAIENTNNTTEAAEYIRNIKKYNGALGVLNFENGDVHVPISFKTIIDGKIVTLK